MDAIFGHSIALDVDTAASCHVYAPPTTVEVENEVYGVIIIVPNVTNEARICLG